MKKYLFIILIVCLFSISAVSAEEINNVTNVMEDTISAASAEEISNETIIYDSSLMTGKNFLQQGCSFNNKR